MHSNKKLTFYEFFAGGGMARAGLGDAWECLFANDYDEKKAESYRRNWGDDHLVVKDIWDVEACEFPGQADLAWASFPCQDLSLAGNGGGLQAERSGSFHPFSRLIQTLRNEGRGPKIVLLENVYGALTSRRGKDFAVLCNALAQNGYSVGALLVDAVSFVPQSRPRLFVIAVQDSLELPCKILGDDPNPLWHPPALLKAYENLPHKIQKQWLWWKLAAPPERKKDLIDLLEEQPTGVAWKNSEYTQKILDMMSDINLRKVAEAQALGEPTVGGVYRRTRNGKQRAEVRFDGVAGCLRTPAGGSSRQLLLIVHGEEIRSRLLSPREAARLMGLCDDYVLPENYNTAYHLAGDGVVVPVVRYLSENLLEPLLFENRNELRQAA